MSFLINPYRFGSAAVTPITLFGSKLEGWYAPESPRTIATGVAQWNDLSAKANHLVQANATAQPTVSTFAGRFAVAWDGVNDFMDTQSTLPMKLAIIACFGYPNNSSSPPFAWSAAGATAANRVHDLHLSSNGIIRAIQNEAGPYADTPTGTAESFYNDCTMAAAYGPSANNQLRAHLNGRVATVNANPTGDTTATFPMRFGQRGDNTNSAAALFTEIIMISSWIASDIEKAEGYFAHRYGGNPLSRLISTHPYKSAPPV